MTTRKILAAIAGLVVAGAFAVVSTPTMARRIESNHGGGGACTLFCIQGYHCVERGGTQTCVPNHP